MTHVIRTPHGLLDLRALAAWNARQRRTREEYEAHPNTDRLTRPLLRRMRTLRRGEGDSMNQQPEPPVTKYELTVRIRGNSHEEIESALLTLTRGGYLLDSDYHKRDEFDCTDGRTTARLVHANPGQTPEKYDAELNTWFNARRKEKS